MSKFCGKNQILWLGSKFMARGKLWALHMTVSLRNIL